MELLLEVINGSELKSGCSPSWAFRPAGGIIGRNFDCEWCIDDQDSYISRQHVCITSEHTAFYLTDISRNGIIVNGIETLKAGVRHRVGQGDTYLLGTLGMLRSTCRAAVPRRNLPGTQRYFLKTV